MKKRYVIGSIAAVLLCLLNAHAREVDLRDLLHETQRLDQVEGRFRMVWWMPAEYWQEGFRRGGNLTAAQQATILKAVEDYVVLCVIDAEITALGAVIPRSKDEIVQEISLTVGDKSPLRPLPDTEISSDAKNLFGAMKPILENMVGQFGKGSEFICFKGKDAHGDLLVDPQKEGRLIVTLKEKIFKWRLPLGSLLPPKYDPDSGEEFPGNYLFNPYTGNKLETKP